MPTPLAIQKGVSVRCSSFRFASLLSISALTLLGSPNAQATSAFWDGAGTSWNNSGSWSTTSGATSPDPASFPTAGDTATFNATTGNTTVTTGNRMIHTILFDGSAAAYTLSATAGTGQITLNDNGALTINPTVANSQLINADVVLGSTTFVSSYNFTNNSTTNGQLLTIAGSVSSNQANATRTKTLTLDGSGKGLISGVINGNGSGGGANETAIVSLLKSGTGAWTLSNANTYSGTTTIRGGSLIVGANAPNATAGALGNANSAIVLGDGSTAVGDAPALLIYGAFNVDRSISVGSLANTAAYNAIIGGSNTTGISTYSGAITLNTTASNYTATLQAATGGTVDFTGTLNTGDKAIDIGSSGNTGTVKLSNTLATTSGVSVNFGTLLLGSSDRLGDATPITVAGGTLDTGTGLTDTVSAFNMSSGSLSGTGTITAATYGLSGGTVTANLGAGTLNASGGTTNLNGTTAATAVNLNSGVLSLGAGNRLANAAAVTVNGGTLAIGGNSDTVGVVSLVSGSITGSGGTLTGSSYAVQAGNVSASLGGSGIALTKTTASVVTLSGANSYTGDTVIQAGTLKLDAAGSLASSNIIVGDAGSSGAILDVITATDGLIVASGQTVQGNGTINGSTTVLSGGRLAPGNSAGILNTDNITLGAGSEFNLELGGTTAGTQHDQLKVTGSATLAGMIAVSLGSFTPEIGDMFFVLANDSNDAISGRFSNAPDNEEVYTFDGQHFQISYFGNVEGVASFTGGNDVVLKAVVAPTLVPEPSAALLGGLGALCLLRRRRDA